MTSHHTLLRALLTGLNDDDRERTAELITLGVSANLETVGGRARRRVDYGTRHRRSGLRYRPPGADVPAQIEGEAPDDRR